MADVFAAFAEQEAQEVISHAERSGAGPVEAVRLVQKAVASGALRKRASGRQDGIPWEEVLLPFVRVVEAVVRGASDGRGGAQASFAVHGRVLRDLRDIAEAECSSLRRESQEQRAGKPSDTLSTLPQLLARCCQAAWRHHSGEDASDLSMNINRVGTLRGAGNAIVPQMAAAFIQAYLEVL